MVSFSWFVAVVAEILAAFVHSLYSLNDSTRTMDRNLVDDMVQMEHVWAVPPIAWMMRFEVLVQHLILLVEEPKILDWKHAPRLLPECHWEGKI